MILINTRIKIKEHPIGKCDSPAGCSEYSKEMLKFVGKIATVSQLYAGDEDDANDCSFYMLKIDEATIPYSWTECMFEVLDKDDFQKVIIMKGLPGSGKTTYAKDLIEKNPHIWKRINKDDLRAMLDNGKWSKENENFVVEIRDYILSQSLSKGYNVVIDDTNLNKKHIRKINSTVKMYQSTFLDNPLFRKIKTQIIDFTNVSPEECIERDKKRINYVGEGIIRQLYNQYLRPKIEKPEMSAALPYAIICDLDGTLALSGDADPFDRNFFEDAVNEDVANLFKNAPAEYKRIIVSGRKGDYEAMTKEWLAAKGIKYDALYMRKPGDYRKDFIIKEEIYNEKIKGQFNIAYVLDDRDQVVDLWRRLGLTCLQVADGNF